MNIPDVTSAINSATGRKIVDLIGKRTSIPTIPNPVMPSEMEQPRVNLLPDSDADNNIVEVNDSCVFKYEFEFVCHLFIFYYQPYLQIMCPRESIMSL